MKGRLEGTREGKIWQLREDKWLAQTNFSQAKAVTALVPDADGSMWVGTGGNGIYRLKNGLVDHIDKRNGLLSDVIRHFILTLKACFGLAQPTKE